MFHVPSSGWVVKRAFSRAVDSVIYDTIYQVCFDWVLWILNIKQFSLVF